MKLHLTIIATGLALLMLQPVQAGGPVILEDTESAPVKVRDKRDHTALLIFGLAALALIAGSGGGGTDAPCYGDPTPEEPGC